MNKRKSGQPSKNRELSRAEARAAYLRDGTHWARRVPRTPTLDEIERSQFVEGRKPAPNANLDDF